VVQPSGVCKKMTRLTKFASILIIFPCVFFGIWLSWQYPGFFKLYTTHIPAGLNRDGKIVNGFFGGDHMQLAYLGWRLKQAFLDGTFNFFTDTYTFVAQNHAFHDFNVGLQFVLIAIFSWLFGDAAGYNTVVIVLSALALYVSTYFMMCQVTESKLVRVLCALFMALLPQRWHQAAGGHSGGIIMMLVPLYWGAVLAKYKMPASRYDLLAGLVLFVTVCSDEHLGYYLLVACSWIFTIWWMQRIRREGILRATVSMIYQWRYLALSLIAAVGYGLLISRMTLTSADDAPKIVRTFSEISSYSAPLASFFRFSSRNMGAILAPGLIIAAVAHIYLERRINLRRLFATPYGAILIAFIACATLMFGVGPRLSQNTGLYELYFRFMPYFSLQRAPVKMFAIVAPLLAILAGNLYENLQGTNNQKGKSGILSYLVPVLFFAQICQFLLFFATTSGGMFLTKIAPSLSITLDALAKQTDERDITLALPVVNSNGRFATLAGNLAMQTERRFSNGYGEMAPDYFLESLPFLSSLNSGIISENARNQILKRGLTHLLLVKYGPSVSMASNLDLMLEKSEYLSILQCDAEYCLYKFNRQLLQDAKLENYGWTGIQEHAHHSGRWMMKEAVRNIDGVSSAMRAPYEVLSYFQLNTQTNKPSSVTITFDAKVDAPLCVLDGRPGDLCFNPPWKQNIDGINEIQFETSRQELFLAINKGWEPRKFGKWEAGIFGHFVTSITSSNKD
jgi:hypothetical protein